MKGYGYLKRIEKGRLTRVNLTKEMSRATLYFGLSISQFFVGFALALACGFAAGGSGNTLWLIGVAIGFLLAFNSAATTCYLEFIKKPKTAFLKEILDVIKAHKIVYLSDSMFSFTNFEQRILLVRRLIKSKNIENYEIIGNFAVVKKSLYLSEDRLLELMKPDKFCTITRIKEDNLEVVESETLIIPKELSEALKRPKEYSASPDLVTIHKSKLIFKNLASSKRGANVLAVVGGINFLLFFVLVILGICINPSGEFPIHVVAFFFMCFLTPVIEYVANRWHDRIKRLTSYIEKIEKTDALSIEDEVFEGLSYGQRIELFEALILAKKVQNRKLVYSAFNTAIVKKELANNLKEIDSILSPKVREDLHKIKVSDARTNCQYCGGNLKENIRYCPHCGISKTL